MGCLSWIIWEKWSRYNGTTLYILLGTIARNTEFVRQQHFVQVTISEERQWSALLTICEGNPPITVGLPQQMANNAENISVTWRVHDFDWGHIQMTGNKYCRVLSSTDITRSNISTYCIYRHRNWGRTSIRGWTDDRLQILSSTV